MKIEKIFFWETSFKMKIFRSARGVTKNEVNLQIFNCEICHKSFPANYRLVRHVREVHIKAGSINNFHSTFKSYIFYLSFLLPETFVTFLSFSLLFSLLPYFFLPSFLVITFDFLDIITLSYKVNFPNI